MKFKVVATNEADPSDLESNADKTKHKKGEEGTSQRWVKEKLLHRPYLFSRDVLVPF